MLHATIGFFERTPMGRILNRFSSDVAFLDTKIPETTYLVVNNMTSILASVAVMSWTTPYFIIVWVTLAGIYVYIQVCEYYNILVY